MTTKQIIEKMEKEFFTKIAQDYGDWWIDENSPGDYYLDDGSVRDFLRSSIRTLLESFGEEIINVVNIGSESNTGTYLVAVRKFRKLQRLKVKEILSNLK